MNDEEFKIVERMEKYGGSFVKALSQCFYTADSKNFNLLKETFSEYWKQYKEMKF